MAQHQTSDAVLEQLKKLHPLLIDLSLERICELLDKLGRPQDRLPPVLHVAGTNGKGSTIAFMQAILLAAGLRVHTYTSPHLVQFHERIQIAGDNGKTQSVTDAQLVTLLQRVSACNGGAPMTFFEITTAAALLAFAEAPADVVLLEVGLGGRLDATNVIEKPALSVITPVSIDHADKLGETLEQIAFEKAGILKPGVAAVIAPQDPAAMTSIEQTAKRVGAPLLCFGQDYDVFEERGRLIFQSEQRLIDLPLPGLIGRNQIVNAGVAIAALLKFSDSSIPVKAIETGLQNAHWPARFSRLDGKPYSDWAGSNTELWLDGGHNPAAGSVLAQTLADLQDRAPKPTFLVVGMMAQKDAVGFLEPFKGLVKGVRAVAIPGEAAGMVPSVLLEQAAIAGLEATSAKSVRDALQEIERQSDGPKRVLICGSLYLAGHVLGQAPAV